MDVYMFTIKLFSLILLYKTHIQPFILTNYITNLYSRAGRS